MTAKLFEAALGIAAPWSVKSVEFDEAARVLTVLVDFEPGTHFAGVSVFLCSRRLVDLLSTGFSQFFRPLPGRRRRPG